MNWRRIALDMTFHERKPGCGRARHVHWAYRSACPAVALVVGTWLLVSAMLACRHAHFVAPPHILETGLSVGGNVTVTEYAPESSSNNIVSGSISLPQWVKTYPSNKKAPCRWKERATRTPLECFRISGKIVGFVDPHTRASTFHRMGVWLTDRVPKCTHVDVMIVHFVMFASEHIAGALAALPNEPLVVAVDQSGEVGELDHANCMFNEHRKNLTQTRFIFVNQAASLHNPGQRFFNQHWLVPRELARLQKLDDTISTAKVDLKRSRILCLGGFPRTHKLQFMGELDASGILDRMQWSGGTIDTLLASTLNKSLEVKGYTSEEKLTAHQLVRKLPHVLDVDRGAKKASDMSYQSALYSLADVHLVLESNFRVPSLDRHACSRTFRYTEKTLKVIYAGARFIVFGDPASLELLRSHGFRTFHPHINETYDTIATYREKVEAIKLELERIVSMTDSEFHAFLAATQSIVDYNRQWLLSDNFKARVHQQSLYAFGLSEIPGFTSPGHEQALDRMYASLNITNCTSSM